MDRSARVCGASSTEDIAFSMDQALITLALLLERKWMWVIDTYWTRPWVSIC